MSQFTLPGVVAVIALLSTLLVLPLLSFSCACSVYCCPFVSVVCIVMSPVGENCDQYLLVDRSVKLKVKVWASGSFGTSFLLSGFDKDL